MIMILCPILSYHKMDDEQHLPGEKAFLENRVGL